MATTSVRSMMPFVAALLLLVVIAPAASEAGMAALPGCPDICGGLKIPYPFGIGEKCYRDAAFEITCKNGMTPVLARTDYQVLNLSVASTEALVQLPISYECYSKTGGVVNESSKQEDFNLQRLYRISDARNELVAIGCRTMALTTSMSTQGKLDFVSSCISYCNSAEDTTDGSCYGVGCCKGSLQAGLTRNRVTVTGFDSSGETNEFSPCSYSFVVDKHSYSFSKGDLKMDTKRMMPVWLDWAIRPPINGTATLTCVEAQKDPATYACKSRNSNCKDAVNGPGYSCQCVNGYEGNPYLEGDGGCSNINECKDPKYTCHGYCSDIEGSYDCICPRGRRGNPKKAPCDAILSREAQIAIGVVCGIAFIIISAVFMLMVHHKRKHRLFFKRNGGPMLENTNNIKIYSKDEMKQITENYSTVLGKGAFGQVYMGTLDNKQQVAVKRSISIDEARKKEFANEVIIQSRISHKNVIRLVGCCLEMDVPMLVYEFAPRGSLYDVLHGTKDGTKISLPLRTRLEIAIDSADGLSYMHSSATQKILHGDVKSGNILLDENFMAKVSDFGTSRLLSIDKKNTMSVIGDTNYIDPVYRKTGCLDEKSDVFSFGVVLLELITRKSPKYNGNSSLRINFINSYMSNERAREMYDMEIAYPQNIECLEKIGGIAVACLKEDMDERPNMRQVSEYLQLVRREWKQKQGIHNSDGVAGEIFMESPLSLILGSQTGAETPDYSPLLKQHGNTMSC